MVSKVSQAILSDCSLVDLFSVHKQINRSFFETYNGLRMTVTVEVLTQPAFERTRMINTGAVC